MSIHNRKFVAITGDTGQATDWVYVKNGEKGVVTISGTFSATLTLQCKLSETGEVLDIDTTTVGPRFDFCGGGDEWRMICKSGDYTSGSAVVVIQG